MGKDLLDVMLFGILPECFRILFINCLGVTAPGIPGEKLKGVCPQCYRFFPHVQIAFGSRKMTANFEHEFASLPICFVRQATHKLFHMHACHTCCFCRLLLGHRLIPH